jgi:acyl transferase domain-containing protein
LKSFTAEAKKVKLHPPKIPYISNLTGTWITAAQAMDANYWASHLRQTVRFSAGLHELSKEPKRLFLEVGPGQTLSSLAKQHVNKVVEQLAISSVHHPHDQGSDVGFLLNTLGRLWLAGIPIDWPEFYAYERRRRVALSTYPFECRRFWIEPRKETYSRGARSRPLDPDVPTAPQDSMNRMERGHVFLEPAVQLDLFVPEHARPELNHSYIPPRNPTEQTLANIWQQLLGLEQVGIHDDFFDLGGHSLLAIQIISRVRNTFRLYLPVDALFENPTIAGLAAQITDALTNAMVVSDDAADMLADLKGLSDEEAERLLGQETSNRI